MRTYPEIFATRSAAEWAVWNMGRDALAGTDHDRRYRAWCTPNTSLQGCRRILDMAFACCQRRESSRESIRTPAPPVAQERRAGRR
jgi:hypothetical protein